MEEWLQVVKDVLIQEGFQGTILQVIKQGQVFGLVKKLDDIWEMHVRGFDDGTLESEIEISRDYLEHFNDKYRRAATLELTQLLDTYEIPYDLKGESSRLTAVFSPPIIQGGPREYPEITAFGGRLGEDKIAIDIKTTRRVSKNRVRGFSIGSYAGYFLHPDQQLPGCKFPYSEFKEHWIVGFVYTWDPNADSLLMVSDIEVIINQKWKIASKSTATGTTFAISSVRDLNALREGRGDFKSPKKFETFWRAKGLRRESSKKKK